MSAALVFAVTAGGWDALQGAKAPQVGAIALYVVMALLVAGGREGRCRSRPGSRSSC
jgi:hypothetical protein